MGDDRNNPSSLIERTRGLHDKLIECHPSLARRQVWCTTCGHTQRVENGLRDGWPKHCGYTMTIDSPEERAALKARSQSHEGRTGSARCSVLDAQVRPAHTPWSRGTQRSAKGP